MAFTVMAAQKEFAARGKSGIGNSENLQSPIRPLSSGYLHLTYQFKDGETICYLSSSGGVTWEDPRVILPLSQVYKDSVYEPRTLDGTHYLVRMGYDTKFAYLYVSHDSGKSYSQNNLIEQAYVHFSELVYDYGWLNHGIAYAVTDDGMIYSCDTGKTWYLGEGFPLEGIRKWISRGSALHWLVGAYGLILHKSGPFILDVDREGGGPFLSDSPSLPIGYPNPATPGAQATIAFNLPRDLPVRLSLHDLLGREVKVIHEGRLSPGDHALPVSTTDLTPGLYFTVLRLPDEVRTGKLVIVR